YDSATVARVLQLLRANESTRRQAAPGPKLSRRAFGRERGYPISSAWRDPACSRRGGGPGGLLAAEGIELAQDTLLLRPVAGQVGVLRIVLLKHAAGVAGQVLLAQAGVGLGHQGQGIALVLALRVLLQDVLAAV